jgi:hypothetical protein
MISLRRNRAIAPMFCVPPTGRANDAANDNQCHRHNAPVLAHFPVSGVDPQTGPRVVAYFSGLPAISGAAIVATEVIKASAIR